MVVGDGGGGGDHEPSSFKACADDLWFLDNLHLFSFLPTGAAVARQLVSNKVGL